MIPDKIYIAPEAIEICHFDRKKSDSNVEYIRKDALLEWAEDVKAKTGWYEIEVAMDDLINKLNSM